MTEKEWEDHRKTCNICFWLLAIWRCSVGAAWLKQIGKRCLP